MFYAEKDTNDQILLAFYLTCTLSIRYVFFFFITSFVNNYLNTYVHQQAITVTNYCNFVIFLAFVCFEVWVICGYQTLINDSVWYLKRNVQVYFDFYGFCPSEVFSTQSDTIQRTHRSDENLKIKKLWTFRIACISHVIF